MRLLFWLTGHRYCKSTLSKDRFHIGQRVTGRNGDMYEVTAILKVPRLLCKLFVNADEVWEVWGKLVCRKRLKGRHA